MCCCIILKYVTEILFLLQSLAMSSSLVVRGSRGLCLQKPSDFAIHQVLTKRRYVICPTLMCPTVRENIICPTVYENNHTNIICPTVNEKYHLSSIPLYN